MNRLKLIADKTEQLICLVTWQQLAKLSVIQLRLTSSVVEFDSAATDLGVVLDSQLSVDFQVNIVYRSCLILPPTCTSAAHGPAVHNKGCFEVSGVSIRTLPTGLL